MTGVQTCALPISADGGLPSNPFGQGNGFSPGIAPGSQLTGGAVGGGAVAGPRDDTHPGHGGEASGDSDEPPGEFIEDNPTEMEGGETKDHSTQ